jgi:alpha-D-ribose 1-methylphosphonate 5-triphosphate synthase subunit PhnG
MPIDDNHATDKDSPASDRAQRRAAMAVLAQAPADDIARGLSLAGDGVEFKELRPTEIGLVMLRGRIGGKGAPFNVGEATVTRAAVQLKSGERGFAYVLGRDKKKAGLAALCDALWQADAHRQRVEQYVLAPLRHAEQERRSIAQAQTAATRVDFFTLVRGENER